MGWDGLFLNGIFFNTLVTPVNIFLRDNFIGWTRPACTSAHSVKGSISLHIWTLKYWIRSACASGHSINEIDQAAQSST